MWNIWNHIAFLLQLILYVNTCYMSLPPQHYWTHMPAWPYTVTAVGKIKDWRKQFNSRRGTHHIKWLHLQSQCMNTNVGHPPTSFYPSRKFGCVKAAPVTCCSLVLSLNTHHSPQQALHGIQLQQHQTSSPLNHYLRDLDADLTTTNSRPQTASLQSLTLWGLELIRLLNSCKPETELVGKIVACPSGSVTFNERGGPEVFEAWSWACKWLATSLSTSCSVLHTWEHYLSLISTADHKVAVYKSEFQLDLDSRVLFLRHGNPYNSYCT